MAQNVATIGIVDDSADWNPPPVLPLNLRSHLGKLGIGNDDLVVLEGLPEGAELTVGVCKPDGSWSIGAAEIDNCAFIPLYENGETYALKACLLTPDPGDHGLPKTKGKAQFSLTVPLAALPVLEAVEEAAPKKPAATTTDAVIILPADPALKAAPAPQQIPAQAQPAAPAEPRAAAAVITPPPAEAAPAPAPVAAAPAAAPAPAAAVPAAAAAIDLDQHFATLRAEWHANVKTQVTAAEKRLKAAHLQQLSKIQTVLSQEEQARTSAATAKWKAELDRRTATVEEELKARAAEHFRGLEARLKASSGAQADVPTADFEERLAAARRQWQAEEAERAAAAEAEWQAAFESAMKAKSAAPSTAADSATVEHAVAQARAAWEIEEAARRAKDTADLANAHQRQVAQLEAQYVALYEMRLASAETAWRKSEAERLAASELTWSKREAERVAGIEAHWRAEHDKRLEVVLANLGTMVKGQVGSIDGTQPLPAIEPTLTGPPPPQGPADTWSDDRNDAVAEGDSHWRKTAAA